MCLLYCWRCLCHASGEEHLAHRGGSLSASIPFVCLLCMCRASAPVATAGVAPKEGPEAGGRQHDAGDSFYAALVGRLLPSATHAAPNGAPDKPPARDHSNVIDLGANEAQGSKHSSNASNLPKGPVDLGGGGVGIGARSGMMASEQDKENWDADCLFLGTAPGQFYRAQASEPFPLSSPHAPSEGKPRARQELRDKSPLRGNELAGGGGSLVALAPSFSSPHVPSLKVRGVHTVVICVISPAIAELRSLCTPSKRLAQQHKHLDFLPAAATAAPVSDPWLVPCNPSRACLQAPGRSATDGLSGESGLFSSSGLLAAASGAPGVVPPVAGSALQADPLRNSAAPVSPPMLLALTGAHPSPSSLGSTPTGSRAHPSPSPRPSKGLCSLPPSAAPPAYHAPLPPYPVYRGSPYKPSPTRQLSMASFLKPKAQTKPQRPAAPDPGGPKQT